MPDPRPPLPDRPPRPGVALDDAIRAKTSRIAREIAKLSGKFEVEQTSPFRVFLDGSPTSSPAKKVAGLSYSVGTTGEYLFLQQGGLPLCIPTAY